MSTSVKVSQADKEKLERLQAIVTLRTGGKVTQQQLLRMLIQEAVVNDDEFLKKIIKPSLPISEEKYRKILSLVDDWGVETSWEEVDKILYGQKSRRR